MDLSHDSTTILGQLRKGQAETNHRLDAIRIELQRLNVHLEQLAAALATRHDEEPARLYPTQPYLSQVALTLRPKAEAAWSHLQTLPHTIRARKAFLTARPGDEFPGKLGGYSPGGAERAEVDGRDPA
jgi:hypothetical protein